MVNRLVSTLVMLMANRVVVAQLPSVAPDRVPDDRIGHVAGGAADARCRDGGYFDKRFVVFDSVGVSGRRSQFKAPNRGAFLTDTAIIWSAPGAFSLSYRWIVLLSPDQRDTASVDERGIAYRQIAPDTTSSTYKSFRSLADAAPCIPYSAMRFIHPLGSAPTLSYLDAVAFATEPSYVTIPFLNWGLPKEPHVNLEDPHPHTENLPLLFEARLAPAFLFSGFTAPFAVTVTPKVVLRQFRNGSSPVDAPNFMPRVTIFYWGPGVPDGEQGALPMLWLMGSHFSNGQEGNPVDTLTGQSNYYTGNFSTNYLELGYSRFMPVPRSDLLQHARWSVDYFIGPTDPHQANQGNWRVNFGTTIAATPGASACNAPVLLGRTDLETTWIVGPLPPAERGWARHLNVSYTGSYTFPHIAWFGFFYNFYNGQDYYNMRFDRRIRVFRVGGELSTLVFALDAAPSTRLCRPSKRSP